MSDANPRDQSSNVKARPPENDRIVIALPYAIANMVFIQSLPFWILGILGAIGFCYGFVVLGSVEAVGQAIAIWIGSAACVVLAVAGWFVLERVLWRWALEGRSTAITVLYVFHAVGIVIGPLLLLPIAAFVFLPAAINPSRGIVWLLAPFVLGGILWFFALMNLFESEIWSFARLDGRCPRCRKWRFGRIRRPQIVQCAECGAELEFDRAP
jgi:hypothetical protein